MLLFASLPHPLPSALLAFDHHILQAAYGIADSALYWSQATGKGWNFVWGVGQTPFGVLSNMHSLSFVQRDAAARNLALSYLNSSITHASLLIGGYRWLSPYEGGHQHVKAFLRPDQVKKGLGRQPIHTLLGASCSSAASAAAAV